MSAELNNFLVINIVALQATVIAFIVGRAALWPKEKLDLSHLFILFGKWLIFVSLYMVPLGINNYQLTITPWHVAGAVFLGTIMTISVWAKVPRRLVWVLTGLFCLIITVTFFITGFVR